jgi:uncharacterized RDD family membrane protein YckC
MSARIEKAAPAKKIQTKQVVIGFDAEKFKAPFLLRCGSLLIDYIILISVPAISIMLGRFMGYDGSKLLNSTVSNSGWLIMFLLGLTNFIIFPMFSGRSIGKMMTGLRITNLDGTMPGFSSLLLRHLIGYPLTLATGMLGFILAAFTGKGRALHDYLSGTMVVYGQKKLKQRNLVRKSELTERNVKRNSISDKN